MFNTKSCPENLVFGYSNDQPIPSTNSDITNYYYDYGNQIDSALADNKGLEYAVVTNDENNYDNSLDSDIDPPQTIFWRLK